MYDKKKHEKDIEKVTEFASKDGVQRTSSSGIRSLMDGGKLDGMLAQRFDFLKGTLNWARENMPERYQATVVELTKRIDDLAPYMRFKLAKTISHLKEKDPNSNPLDDYHKAARAVFSESEDQLQILNDYLIAMAQYRDGYNDQIKSLATFIESAYSLFVKGEFGSKDDLDALSAIERPVKNVFLFKLAQTGPETDIAAIRQMKTHLMAVNYEHLDSLVFNFPAYLHELGHSIWAEIPGIWQESQALVAKNVHDAVNDGAVKPSFQAMNVLGTEHSAANIIAGIYYDLTPEIVADVFAALLAGPAYLFNMLIAFPAMNSDSVPVAKTVPMLRNFSYYRFHEDRGTAFDPHPQDYLRVLLVAKCLEKMGFEKEAHEALEIADQAIGDKKDSVIWMDVEQKNDFVLELKTEDLAMVADQVLDTLMNKKFKSLNGLSLAEIGCWSSSDQEKMLEVADSLETGVFPDSDSNKVQLYVVSAASVALWKACRESEGEVSEALDRISFRALHLLEVKSR